MPVFFSLNSDVFLATMAIAMLLAGMTCLALARETSIARPVPSWHYLGISFLILAFRDWFGVIGLSYRGFGGFAYAALLQIIACIPLLLGARIEAPPRHGALRFLHSFAAILLFLLFILILMLFCFSYQNAVPPQIGRVFYFAIKGSFLFAVLLFTYCTLKGDFPPNRSVMKVMWMTCAYFLVVAVCYPPGLPTSPSMQNLAMDKAMAIVYLLRLGLAVALTTMLWNRYAKSLGVIGSIRWWPFAVMASFVALGLVFVHISKENYQSVVRNNLAASAANAATAIPHDVLTETAANPGSANHPQIAERLFKAVRALDFYVGYTRMRAETDALAFDPNSGEVGAVIDVAAHPSGGTWAKSQAAVRDLWNEVLTRDVHFQGVYENSLQPALVVAPIRDEAGMTTGAAIVTLSSIDLALDLYVFKRLALLFLPLAFFAILLLVRGQQRAWLSSHSINRAEALKLGVLGNDLAGVMISRGDVIVDVNKSLCDLVGMRAENLVGQEVSQTLDTMMDDPSRWNREVQESIEEKGSAFFETRLHTPDQRDIHVMVHVRKLHEDATDDNFIWETVDITHQKSMENQIREARDHLQMVIDSAPVAVFVKGPDNRYRLANQTFASLMGKNSVAEILGKTCGEINPDAAREATVQDEICMDMRGATLVCDQTFPVVGEKKTFEVSKAVKWPGPDESDYLIVGSMHDLTNRKRAEDAIKAERHFLYQLINALPVVVCFIDRNRAIRLCDQQFCQEAGVDSPEDLIGRPYDEVAPFGPGNPAEDLRMLERGSGYSDMEFELNKEGRHRNFMLRRIAMSNSDGAAQGLLLAFWDTTSLVAANRAARNADRARAAFLSNMSHEFRTPMNGIVGMADLIMEHGSTEPVQSLYAETIIRSAKTLQMVMDEVMDIATIDNDAKRLPIVNSPFPLLTLVEEAAEIAGCIMGALGIDLILDYDFTLHPVYIGDARRIRQIIVQILTHCSHLTADKRLGLAVLSYGEKPEESMVGIRVDFHSLPSTDAVELEAMFKNLAQPVTDDKQPSNLGIYNDRIGLPLVWRLLQAMNGELEVTGDEEGLHCVAKFPLQTEDRDHPRLTPPDLGGLRVALAYVDGDQAMPAASCLRYGGAETETVTNEQELLHCLRDAKMHQRPYDFLLLDTRLFDTTNHLAAFIKILEHDASLGNPMVMPIVTVRNFQEVSGMDGGQVKSLLLHPLCPSDLWFKMDTFWNPEEAEAPPDSAQSAPSRKTSRIIRKEKVRANVLLVEDNTVNQMVAVGILKRLGCHAVIAKNGVEAVARIRAGESYDLIFMDCMMPMMDGYEATGHIRLYEKTHPGTKRNIIVALTANSVPGDMEKCLASGMDGYLPKPITLEIVREAIYQHCPYLAVLSDEPAEKGAASSS